VSRWALLPWLDLLAVAGFFAGWAGYAWFAVMHGRRRSSLLDTSNRVRRDWMEQMTWREVRIIDGAIAQSLSTSPNFFASTTILIIGGLLAALGTSEKASEMVQELPFAVQTTSTVFDLKLVMLTGVFVHAFFRFTWSMRQYSFGALLVAAAPTAEAFAQDELDRAAWADRAGTVMGLAAEAFNDGLRAYYFSFAAVAWFFSPLACLAATVAVIQVLYRREFHSAVLVALRG